jgi:hypothetical protein
MMRGAPCWPVTKKLKICLLSLVFTAVAATAQAVALTHFVLNATGGFDAFIYPELLSGAPSSIGDIFTLPQPVNAGYVVILKSGNHPTNIANWMDVIHFIDNGHGKATTVQMLDGGGDQASYFPSLSVIKHNPSAFIIEGAGDFTDFTDYSVKGKQKRNYHFYTADARAVPDSGSTLMLLGLPFIGLVVLHPKRLPA